MDDILAAHKDRALLQQILSELIEALEDWGLKIELKILKFKKIINKN